MHIYICIHLSKCTADLNAVKSELEICTKELRYEGLGFWIKGERERKERERERQKEREEGEREKRERFRVLD